MKRILIIGAGPLQKPAIDKAKERGLEVVAVDQDPHSVGFQNADVCVPISTTDIPAVIMAAQEHRVDGVMTLCTDMPIRTVAAVAEACGLIGLDRETSMRVTDKAVMRQCLLENGLPGPRFYRVDSRQAYDTACASLGGSFVVKPTDNSGSRGVFLVQDSADHEQRNKAFVHSNRHARTGAIIVEEYMEGEEVSVETLSIDGNVHVLQITDKVTTGAPFFVEMGHSQPTRLSSTKANSIARVAKLAVKALGIRNGPSHTEIMMTADGPKIVEIGARLGGDCITTHLVPLSTGIDMVQCCIQIALGEEPDLRGGCARGAAIRYYPQKTGVIRHIEGLEAARKIEGVREVNFFKGQNDSVAEVDSSAARIGFVIAQADTAEAACLVCDQAISCLDVKMGG